MTAWATRMAFVGAAFLGLEARGRAGQAWIAGRGRRTAAIVTAAVTLVATVVLAIFGM